MSRTVIIGGSSGLGLELARREVTSTAEVHVTGRRDSGERHVQFHKLVLNGPGLPKTFAKFFAKVGHVDKLIFSAGFFQSGKLDELSESAIEAMVDVGARALIYAVREVLRTQPALAELVVITSTAQFVPRVDEPVYNFVKAGAGHFGRAMADDPRIKKVLVAAPAGMRTAFWRATSRDDLAAFLDPIWVADQIATAEKGSYRYRFIKLLRQPARVEEVETF